MLNEPENDSEDGNSGQALHRGTATEITTDHSYIYAGGKLLRETISEGSTTKTLDFTYDNVGMPYSLTYNNGTTSSTYYYITNLQGDVMYLVDASGNEVAAYDYDPYGKVITATGAMAEINPLRYRGYYYDTETGFYYLQSRYYDPEICRFINADSYASTGQGLLGYNAFVYCGNNPIPRADTSGDFWNFVIGAVVGAVVGAISTAVDAYKTDGWDAFSSGKTWAKIGVSSAIGAVSGLAAASGIGVPMAVGIGAATGFSESVLHKAIDGKDFSNSDTWTDIAVDTLSGAVGGLLGGSGAIRGNKYMSRQVSRLGKHLISDGIGKAGAYFYKMTANYSKQFILKTAWSIAKSTFAGKAANALLK